MQVHSDRRHRFDVTPAELWAALSAIEDYPAWWPWLRAFDAERFEVGEVWRCTVQPPVPYTLRFTVTIEELVAEERVAASIGGDLAGHATLQLRPLPHGRSEARLVSELAPAHRVLQAVATFARPVVRFGHDWVLDTGARQFRAKALAPAP